MLYSFESYTLDSDRRELRRGDALIRVEPQVFDVLHHLIRSREHVVSRDALLADIWQGRVVSDATLSSRINAARTAIGDNGERQRLIRTISRKGFRFVAAVREQSKGTIEHAQLEALDSSGQQTAPTVAPLERPSGTVGSASGERRQLTVLSCELIGMSSDRMDPEDLSDLSNACHRWVRETVAPFGGFVGRPAASTPVALFGYPAAAEDDAEQAVRAGLALCAAVGAFKADDGLARQCRVGIATGLVIVRDGGGSEADTVGEPLNMAARLQTHAPPNAVLIEQSTKRLIGNLFDCRDLGATGTTRADAAGVGAWQVVAPSAFESRFEALHTELLTPLVGREEELEILLRRWHRAKAGEGCVVQISGEPGIGKSRVVLALQEALQSEPHAALRYFCSPHHTDSALYPVISQFEHAAKFKHEDTSQARLDKVDAVLAQTTTSMQDAALIADMLLLRNDGRYPVLELTPRQRRQRTMDALVAQLETMTHNNPVLMIFEDAHWIDPTSLEFLGRLIDRIRTLRVLLVTTFRPEFDAPWTGRPYVTALTMKRLTERESGAMIDRIVGEEPLPAAIRQEIIERTDGVALFVEEITKAVLEAKIEGSTECSPAMVTPAALEVPASLHASLMARLDRLGDAREVAQIGAAIGREFSHALLSAVLRRPEKELKSSLDRLASAGLLFRQGVPPHATYVFKHALVQDAAYGSLVRKRRRQLHAEIADAIEAESPESARDQPELLAMHLLNAGQEEKALPHVLAAARIFTRRYSYMEALRWFERGAQILSQLSANEDNQRLKLDLYVEWTPVLMTINGYTDQKTIEVAKCADELCRHFNVMDKLLPALFAQASFYGAGGGSLYTGIEFAARMIEVGEGTGDAVASMVGHRFAGFCHLWTGSFGQAVDQLTHALHLARGIPGDGLAEQFGQDPEITSFALLGSAKQLLGLIVEGESLMQTAVVKARKLTHPLTLAYALRHWVIFAAVQKNYTLLESLSEELTSVCLKYQIRQWFHLGPLTMAWARFHSRHDMSAIPLLQALLEQHRGTGFRRNLPFYLMLAAEALGDSSNPERARQLLDEAHSLMLQLDEMWIEPHLVELTARLDSKGK